MAFRPPDFNLLANLWTCSGTPTPAGGSPDYENIPVQKYVAARSSWPVQPAWANGFFLQFHPPVQLRFPRVEPFLDPWPLWEVTSAEVPAGSGQYYRCFWNDVQHEGFVNEYVLMVAVQCTDELLAIPPSGSTESVGIGADPCGNTPPQDAIRATIPGSILCCDGEPPPSEHFLANFDGTVGTPLDTYISDSGESWSPSDDSFELTGTGGVIQPTDDLGDQFGLVFPVDPADGTLTCTFTTGNPITNPTNVGVIFRVFSTGDFWWIKLWDSAGAQTVDLNFVSSGTPASVWNTTIANLSDDTTYTITVITSGDDMHVEMSDPGGVVFSTDYNDATLASSTGVGFYMNVDSDHLTVAVGQMEKTP